MSSRHEFIALLGGAAVAWPFAVSAQQSGKVPTVGFLGSGSPTTAGAWVADARCLLRCTCPGGERTLGMCTLCAGQGGNLTP
jgi:hypothetical protein